MAEPERVLILEARFYADLADQLFAGAERVFEGSGVEVARLAVPGCFELPAALAAVLRNEALARRFSGYVALGCVIRGETDHYDYICREVSRGLMQLSIDHVLALGFGVLTCRDGAQARVRASPADKDKGGDAARACLAMMALHRQVAGLA